jgi:hypothetical protein
MAPDELEIESSEKTLERQIRAFHWVRLLAEIPERVAGGEGEREAAHRVESWLREIGFTEVDTASVTSRPRRGAVVALHAALAVLGCLLPPLAGFPLVALVALSLQRELRGQPGGLSRWLPAPDSVLVRACAGSARPRRRVVLCASLDAPQTGRLFGSPALAFLLGRSSVAPVSAPAGFAAWLRRLLLAALVVTAAAALGADGWLVGFLRAALVVAFGGVAWLGFDHARAAASPGANANASGVAAMLTCGEQLLAQLGDDDALCLVAAGAHETGGAGMHTFLGGLDEADARRSLFVAFDRVGGEQLHWVRAEVGLERVVHPARLPELARRVAESSAFGDVRGVDWVGTTVVAPAVARDLHALALVSLDADGRPRHEASAGDLPEALDMANVVRAADFAGAVAAASLRGEGDPLAFV